LSEIDPQPQVPPQSPPVMPARPPGAFVPTGQVTPVGLQYATPMSGSSVALRVRAVGLAQRRIMWVILAAILLAVSFAGGSVMAEAVGNNRAAALAVGIGMLVGRLAIIVLMMIGVYQLAAALGASMTTRVLYTIAMLIPCVGLIILLIVNQQATSLLREHRIKVGLMGAHVADLPAA
jgi:hypothetical protein